MTSAKNGTIVAAPNRLEDYLGEITNEQKYRIRGILRSFREGIRLIVGHSVPEAKNRCKELHDPCDRCFFGPKAETFPDFELVTYGLIESLCNNKEIPCRREEHIWRAARSNQSNTFEFCRVFVSFMLTRKLETVTENAEVAMIEIRKVVCPPTA